MNDKARQHVLAAFIIILLLLCIVSSFYNFPIQQVKADALPPTITINFAGNLSDSGGPYWRPPGESTQLTGTWSDGYYTNDSRQSEGWMYINLSVSDIDGVPNVWLQWKNESTWTNYTYAFLNTTGGYFEFNTSGNISTGEGYNYSFNIVANDTGSNSDWVGWNKTGSDGTNVRRYVQLNCTPIDITYKPLYFYNATFGVTAKQDRLEHDQATGTITDTGYLNTTVPTNIISIRYCGVYTSYWFNNESCIEPFTLNNIYFHFFYTSDTNILDKIGWVETRGISAEPLVDYYSSNSSNNRMFDTFYYDTGYWDQDNYNYSLETSLLTTTNTVFSDNDIYELSIYIRGNAPTTFSNRSYLSFILLNVPDNATLNASYADSDSDGLSDWTELYVNYTNPFLADTDNDGISDYDETVSGSDPNNYTDTIEADLSTTIDTISPYNQTTTPLTITATSSGATPDNITLYYRYSSDNVTWDNESTVGGSYTFGETGTGDIDYHLEGQIYAMYAMPINGSGTVNNITIWIADGAPTVDIQCALYEYTDYSSDFAGTRIATSEMKACPYTGTGWMTFNITASVTNGTNYYIVVWGNDTASTFRGGRESSYYQTWYKADSGQWGWDSPITGEAASALGTICAYASYTVADEDENWTLFETDISSPWSWSFNFPDGGGYYEFYSIANKSGLSNESAPPYNDTLCQYTNYTPSVPTFFTATAYNTTQINITWVKGTYADKTNITAKEDSYPSDIDDGTQIYNGTGTNYEHSGLNSGSDWYYRAWSWNDSSEAFSSSYASATSTTHTAAPIIESPTPNNGSTDVDNSLAKLSVWINDSESDTFNWTIECSNGDSSNADGASDGLKNCTMVATLNYSATYTWYVNATDLGSGNWTNVSYTFTIEADPESDTNYYVKNGGNDGASGLDDANAWATIGKVSSELNGGLISEGDDVYFKGGDIFSDALLTLRAAGGTASNFMIIGSYGTGRAIFGGPPAGNHIYCSVATDHLRIEDIEFTGTTSYAAINFDNNCGASDIEIDNVYIHDITGHGMMIRDTNGYKVENFISSPGSASYHGIAIGVGATNGIVRNGTISNCKDGINFHFRGPAQSQGPVGDNHLIENISISSAYSAEESIDMVGGDGCDNVMVRNCTITGSGGASFHVGHGTDQVFVDGCYMYSQKGMLVLSDTVDGTFRNCKLYDWTTDGGIMKSSTGGVAERITIYNNDFVANGAGDVHMEIKNSDISGWVVKNNIFTYAGSAASRYFDTDGVTLAGAGADFSYNMWYPGTGSNWQVDATNYNWAGWQGLAQVSNELQDDPELADPANGIFTLSETSPCIDAGDWLTQTNGGSTGTTITVDDAGYFFPGFTNIGSRDENVPGDNIFVGGDTDLQVTVVNYASNTITVNRSITWLDGENVSLSNYAGAKVDIGAEEYDAGGWTNSAPVNSVPSPSNGETGVSTSLANLSITVTDVDIANQSMNVTFRTNASGEWLDCQTNSSVSNGVIRCLNTTWITAYNTKYWWSVNTSDNATTPLWDNDTYYFTTFSIWNNSAPVSSSPSPENNSLSISISLSQLSITINDADGNNTWGNITLSNGNTSSWSNQTNGTFNCAISDLEYSGLELPNVYTWWVNFTDGIDDTNNTYFFTMEPITKPTTPTDLVAYNPTTDEISLNWTKGYMAGTLVHDILYVDNFTKYGGNPVLSGTKEWNEYGIRDPFFLVNSTGVIVKEDDKYIMYFNGRNYTTFKTTRISRANSTDGITWTQNDSWVFNDTLANNYTSLGSVIKHDGDIVSPGDYIMYYVNNSGTSAINYATSPDGIVWTPSRTGYLLNESNWTDCNGVRLPFVTYIDGEWHMVCEGVDVSDGEFHIYYANSSDGLNWTALADPIYSGGADGNWDSDGQANPQLIELEAGKYVICYNGRPEVTPWHIGILNSTSIASGWGEWDNNPILEVGAEDEWDDKRIEGMRILKEDINNATLRMWYFGLPTSNSYEDGAIGYAVCNETITNTMVRYSTSDNLTTYTDGSLGYDGTDSYTTITGLDPDTTYYFRAWSWNETHGWNTVGSNTVSETTEVFTEWSNSNPVNSNPDPENSNTSVSLTPTLRSQVNDVDMDNQSVNTTWMSDSSGSWVQFGSNTSSSNTTFYQTFINASAYGTTYYWSTNTSDGNGGWDNDTYSFTTLVNASPSISNPSPGNGASGVGVSLSSLSVTIEDNEDTFNWTITTNPNVGSNNANGASNGSKTCSISGLSYDGYYTWTVSVTDGISWTNTTYDFTVESDPGGGPPLNSAPTASNPYPADEATSFHITPICHVLVADANLDSIDVNFYWYNDTNQWEKMQTNSSVASGNTVYWTFSDASGYNTIYYWNVTVDDGTDNITYSYSFTTISDNPVISTYSPANGAVDVTRNTSVSITIFDYQGDIMNITWRSNSSGSWLDFGWNVSVHNGTFSQRFINSTGHNTRYWWSVNITGSWTNATYSFTTKLNVAPVISSPIPRDGRRWVSIYMANVSIMITDANSDFNYTIETDPDVGSISENNVDDGVKTCIISGLAYSTTYTWYVNATDNTTWVRASYTFTTKGSTDFDLEDFKLNLPEWALGPFKVYVDDFVWIFIFVGVIAITWGSSKHVSSVFIVILLTFAAYGTQKVFIDTAEISLLFSLIAAVCIAAVMLGLFLKKRNG